MSWLCPACDFESGTKQNHNRHISGKCARSIQKIRELKEQADASDGIRVHISDMSWLCPACDFESGTKRNHNRHISGKCARSIQKIRELKEEADASEAQLAGVSDCESALVSALQAKVEKLEEALRASGESTTTLPPMRNNTKLKPEQRLYIAARQSWKCLECDRILTSSFHIDHIKPRAEGGGNERSNLRALCATCHGQVTAKWRLGAWINT